MNRSSAWDGYHVQETLRFILIAVSAGVIGYIGWTLYEEETRTTAARMSESVLLAQAQAESVDSALTHIQDITFSNAQTPATTKIFETPNLEALMKEWEPRYAAAKTAYVKFHASIMNAKSRASSYFAQQRALTEQMRDPENQAKARLEDEADLALYRQWEAQADQALEKANQIGIQLDDMDANLSKMELRADFVFDTSAFPGNTSGNRRAQPAAVRVPGRQREHQAIRRFSFRDTAAMKVNPTAIGATAIRILWFTCPSLPSQLFFCPGLLWTALARPSQESRP